jgi:regulatory protein
LRSELRLQGVADEVASEALEALSTEDEFARAKQLVLRRIRATGSLGDEKQIRRISGMLQRKGYSLGLIAAVLREVSSNPA